MRGLSAADRDRRRKFLTGSDAKAVMDGEWKGLWLQKTGREPEPDLSGVFEVQLGLTSEALNLEWLERTTGRAVTARGQWCQCIEYPWMGCTLDGMTHTEKGEPAVVDAKHVARDDDKMVERYTPQLTHNATVLQVDWWILSVIAGNKWHPPIVQAVDPFYQAQLIRQENIFWSYVEQDIEPEDQITRPSPKPQPRLRVVQLDQLQGTRDWPNWGQDAVNLIRQFAETEASHRAHMAARDDLKKLVPEDVGTVSRGLFVMSRTKAGAVTMKMREIKEDG